MAAFSEMILLMCCSRICGLVTCGLVVADDSPGPRTSTLSRGGASLSPASVSSSLRPGLEPYTVLGMFTSPLQPVTAAGGVTGVTTGVTEDDEEQTLMMALFPLQDDEVVESLGRAESPPLRESLAEGEEFTTSLVTSLGGKQNSLGDDERLQSLEVAPTSILSGRSRESLDDRCSLEGLWNSRGDVTRHAPPGSRRSLDVAAGSLADEARSPATRSPPGSISAHGLSSCPGDAFRGTRGPCTTAILRLGTVCRGGAQGSWPPEATGAAGPPPSGPFMARPPASPSSRVRRAAITTGDRRFTAPIWHCLHW